MYGGSGQKSLTTLLMTFCIGFSKSFLNPTATLRSQSGSAMTGNFSYKMSFSKNVRLDICFGQNRLSYLLMTFMTKILCTKILLHPTKYFNTEICMGIWSKITPHVINDVLYRIFQVISEPDWDLKYWLLYAMDFQFNNNVKNSYRTNQRKMLMRGKWRQKLF